MTLPTGLSHLETAEDLQKTISENENVMVCCGRMGPMCMPVYSAMQILETENKNIKFFDMAFDSLEAKIIRDLPECQGFAGLPFTVYYKKGKVVKATTSIQSKEQIEEIIKENFMDN